MGVGVGGEVTSTSMGGQHDSSLVLGPVGWGGVGSGGYSVKSDLELPHKGCLWGNGESLAEGEEEDDPETRPNGVSHPA